MDNLRNDLVVIVAGYKDEMKRFIQSNPGLASRFISEMEFDDYTDDELAQIFAKTAEKVSFHVDQGASAAARHYLQCQRKTRGREFGNGREVRNLWEATLRRQAMRLVSERKEKRDIVPSLARIVAEDIPPAARGPWPDAGSATHAGNVSSREEPKRQPGTDPHGTKEE